MKSDFCSAEILDELLGKDSGPKPNVFMAVPTIYVKLIDEIKKRNMVDFKRK